ncbi:MAG TPA: sulfopyruvate decarboxylase subunit alpha [Methanomassiliicoccales archaeon]|nr:sulfopyruvate decarboxylase subunit alpha [Methanomassiliicoccales archaeon]
MNAQANEVFSGMKKIGIGIVTSVPCVNLTDLIALIEADTSIRHLAVSREEEGVGICAGAYLGGMKPALLMQNSGLGNSINALASLDLLYGIPLLIIVSHRGVEGEEVSAQVPMGLLTEPLLRSMGIPAIKPGPGEAEQAIVGGWSRSIGERKPVAILLDNAFWRSQ